jgi:hypothetical protein
MKKFLSIVLAAIERDQGESFVMVARSGPLLPADFDVNIPFLVA